MLELKTITVPMVRGFYPCYDPTDVVPEDWSGTALDVLNLPVPTSDRLWVVLREEILPEWFLREFTRWCALRVIHLWDAPDVVKQYLETGDETLREAAGAAAGAAAWDAVGNAVGNAARAAAWAAAWAAARAAARGDAGGAARAATWAAAWDDAGADQLKHLKAMIERELA